MSLYTLKNISVRTYNKNISQTIAIISNNYETIKKFTDKYSGIYNITPLFISTKYQSSVVTIFDFNILGNFPELKITYNNRDCVDFEKCDYCGDCYRVCPANCIDLDLNIDLDKCTLCDKCKQVCKKDAIDINIVGNSFVEVSFVVTDIKDIIDQHSKNPGVFAVEDMDEIFSLTGEFEISEIVEHNENICQFNKKLKYGCERCLEECPHNALYVEDGVIKVNHILCKACGKCVAVCPTGAMQNALFSDNLLIDQLNTQNCKGKIPVIGTDEDLRKFSWANENTEDFLKIEANPNFFNAMNYLLFFAKGYSDIYLLGEEKISNNQTAFANKLVDYLFKKKDFIKYSTDYKISDQTSNSPVKDNFQISHSSRRDSLSAILKFLYKTSGIKGVLIDEPFLNIFGEVLVDETKCSLCLSCVQHCKIGALTANTTEYSLNHRPSICIQCRICQEVCPEKAIKIQNGLLLSDRFFENHILHKDEPVVCPSCGKEFGVKSAHEKVMKKLKMSGFDDKRLSDLKYCETCRVKNKFEEVAND